MILPKDTVVVCPDCHAPQIISTKEIGPGNKLGDAKWESLGFDMHDAIRMACNLCGTLWSRLHPKTRDTQIYTEKDGWVSLSKNKDTVTKKLII